MREGVDCPLGGEQGLGRWGWGGVITAPPNNPCLCCLVSPPCLAPPQAFRSLLLLAHPGLRG